MIKATGTDPGQAAGMLLKATYGHAKGYSTWLIMFANCSSLPRTSSRKKCFLACQSGGGTEDFSKTKSQNETLDVFAILPFLSFPFRF